MKDRKLKIEKVGLSTVVTTWPENYPEKNQTFIYNGNFRTSTANGVIFVEAIQPDLNFLMSELTTLYGATTPNELLQRFSELYIFTEGPYPAPGWTEQISAHISFIAEESSSFIQDNRLIGASKIDGMSVAGTMYQPEEIEFNSSTGTINFGVEQGEKIIIFYTNPPQNN